MIVNPAYIYMGIGGAPGNPVIFQQNEINYKYSGTNFTKTTEDYFEMQSNSELIFENLDLTNFEKLKVMVQNTYPRNLYLTVNFITSSGKTSDNIENRIYANNTRTYTFNIPTDFKDKKMKIKFSLGGGSLLTLQSAILS